jgi:NADPH:quinone reductase-like Zn-dependent oxidoreductase
VLWVGTYGGGLNRFDRDTGQFARYDTDDFQNVTNSPEEFRNVVWAIDERPAGVLWIATYGGGLVRFDLETETFTSYAPDPADPDFWGHEWITALLVDRSGMVWIGTSAEGLDPAEAVCLVANYLIAHLLLHRTASVRSGERVLVQGAAGGTGTALLELGKLAGLEMYGTASKYNHELVSALGATPIDYRTEDFVERIRSLTGDGVDAVFDPGGGARHIWRSYRALRKGGRLVSFGVAATSKEGGRVIPPTLPTVFLLKLIPDGKQASMSPNLAEFAPTHNAWYRETLTELLDSLAEGTIKPVMAERIPLLEAARAHELLERGGYAGKVVLVANA